jgi:hypothetical protein
VSLTSHGGVCAGLPHAPASATAQHAHHPLLPLPSADDAGATLVVEGHRQACYASNGGNVNVCRIDFPVRRASSFGVQIDSHHSTWNWFGNCKPIIKGCDGASGECSIVPHITVSNGGTPGSTGNCHGGHCGESSDPADAFRGKRIMFGSPSTYDVLYQVCYPQPVIMSSIVGDYDAGATLCLDGKCQSCYDTNGGSVNQCEVHNAHGGVHKSCYMVKIDSHHSTWNWMGNFKFTVKC